MKTSKFMALMVASAMLAGSFTACSDDDDDENSQNTENSSNTENNQNSQNTENTENNQNSGNTENNENTENTENNENKDPEQQEDPEPTVEPVTTSLKAYVTAAVMGSQVAVKEDVEYTWSYYKTAEPYYNFTIPAFTYGKHTLTQFTVENITLDENGNFSKDFEVTDEDGKTHKGTLSGNANATTFTYTDQYGSMPMPITFNAYGSLAELVANQYAGWQTFSIATISSTDEVTIVIEKEDANNVKVTIPEFTYKAMNYTLPAVTIPNVAVSLEDGVITLAETEYNVMTNETDEKSTKGSFSGTVTLGKCEFAYTEQYGNMPFKFTCTFTTEEPEETSK